MKRLKEEKMDEIIFSTEINYTPSLDNQVTITNYDSLPIMNQFEISDYINNVPVYSDSCYTTSTLLSLKYGYDVGMGYGGSKLHFGCESRKNKNYIKHWIQMNCKNSDGSSSDGEIITWDNERYFGFKKHDNGVITKIVDTEDESGDYISYTRHKWVIIDGKYHFDLLYDTNLFEKPLKSLLGNLWNDKKTHILVDTLFPRGDVHLHHRDDLWDYTCNRLWGSKCDEGSLGLMNYQFDLIPNFILYLDEMRNQSNNKNKRLFENSDPYLLNRVFRNTHKVSKTKTNTKVTK